MIKRITLLALVLLAGCAPMKPIDSSNVEQVFDDFSSGKTILEDTPTTIANYVHNRVAFRTLYAAQNWELLAKKLIQVNYGTDLTWYYLGQSAEGLGFDQAAQIYYLNSTTAVIKCRGVLIGNDCDGFTLPDDAIARMRQLSAKQNPARAAPARSR